MHPASPTPCSTQPKQKIRSLAGGLPINLVLVFLISWNLNECYGSPEGVGRTRRMHGQGFQTRSNSEIRADLWFGSLIR